MTQELPGLMTLEFKLLSQPFNFSLLHCFFLTLVLDRKGRCALQLFCVLVTVRYGRRYCVRRTAEMSTQDFTVRQYPDAVTICDVDQAARIVTHNACDPLKRLHRPWLGWIAYIEHPDRLGSPTTSLTPAGTAN
jgi:hypothetical protein